LWLGCGDGGNPGGGGGGSLETVPLGGLKWMTKNLDVKTADSWCYENSPDSCAKYGRLYTWEAAKTACQLVGKRLPTFAEWNALVAEAGGINIAGNKLKSKSGWKSYIGISNTDDFGFSALPGGRRLPDGADDAFHDAGNYGYWWTATETDNIYYTDGYYAYSRLMDYNNNDVYLYYYEKGYGQSVRCVSN